MSLRSFALSAAQSKRLSQQPLAIGTVAAYQEIASWRKLRHSQRHTQILEDTEHVICRTSYP